MSQPPTPTDHPGAVQFGWINDLQRERRPGPGRYEKNEAPLRPSSQCVHAGSHPDPATGAVGTPIYQNTTFLLSDEQYAAIDLGFARDRFIYTRYGNPSQWAIQNKIASLEGAQSALVFSSGMAAISATIMGLVDPGGHVVTSRDLYGGTYSFFMQELPNCGMSATFVDPRDLEAVEAAIQKNTQILYFEAISNPLLKVLDIEKIVELAGRYQLRVVIDATFVTPVGCRYLDYGVDIVVHSASKYLNGHSDLIAGAVCGSRKLVDMIWPRLLNFGGCLDPHACFLLERGMKTLAIRMQAHERAARALAEYLEGQPLIEKVLYPGLHSHPDHALAHTILKNTGGMVTFVVKGGDTAALRLTRQLQLCQEATSLGGVESLVSLPFNTSHAAMTATQRLAMGILPGTVRLSVGIEDPDDLIRDFSQALERLKQESYEQKGEV